MPSERPEVIATDTAGTALLDRLAAEAAEMAYLEEESARYAASRTPKLDAGYADEDPGDGDLRRHGR